MKKKFLTNQDRLKNLEKRGDLIKDSFKKEFNKIKRLDEAQFNDTYFDTLSGALDVVRQKAIKMGLIVNEPDMWTNYGTGGIGYGETKRAFIKLLNADGEPILNKHGKELNRGLVVSIYRMDSGKYELTVYKSW